jgi:hypothetical protein
VGDPLGDGLGLAQGDALGEGLGLAFGDALGEGDAEPNVPASTTTLPFNTWTGMPAVMTGTGWPSSVWRLKENVLHGPTLVWPTTALLIDTVRTVPDGRLTDEPSTSRRLRF